MSEPHAPDCKSRAVNGDVYYPEMCTCHVRKVAELEAALYRAHLEIIGEIRWLRTRAILRRANELEEALQNIREKTGKTK